MTSREIMKCNDIEKLKKVALIQSKIISYISETMVDLSKSNISEHEAVEDIKDYIYKHEDELFELDNIGLESKDKVVLINDKTISNIHDTLIDYVPTNGELHEALDKIKEILEYN